MKSMGYRAHQQPTHKAKARMTKALRRRQVLQARRARKLARRQGLLKEPNSTV